MGGLPIVGTHVTQNPNDKQEMEPAVAELAKRPETLGAVERMAADNGYGSAHNVEILVSAGIEPPIAVGRQRHHEALAERLAPVPEAPPNPDAMGAMRHRLKTKAGKALQGLLRQTENHVGTGVWHHQGSDGVSPVLVAGPGGGERRMAVGVPGVQPEAAFRLTARGYCVLTT